MKKFLWSCAILIAVCLAGNYFYYFSGKLYLPASGEITCFTKSDADTLYLDKGNGWEPFEIRGVNLGLGKPGYFATEGGITKEEYLRWFAQIQELGANVIRTYTIAHPAFYEAFYEYNTGRENPLYLIHGVWVDDYLINSAYSAFDAEFYEPFLESCLDVVDVIHGRHKRSNPDGLLAQKYDKDISQWVYGLLLGIEWEGDIVSFTNESQPQAAQYDGTYLYTEDAENFEIFLAAIGDQTISYEMKKYGAQHLVAFVNWPTTCPLDFSEKVRQAHHKYAKVDVNHILMRDAFTAGTFASYHIYPYYPEYLLYEEETSHTENTYLEYLKRLTAHHTMPVVVTEFGIPSSRGCASYEQNRALGRDQGCVSEQKQGEAAVSLYQDIQEAGCAGGVLFIWQDEWFKRTWNTMPTVDLQRIIYWHDYQTNEQSFGLLSFDPGKEKSICYVDGDKTDWDDADLVTEQDGYRLSMKYDLKFLYFLVEKKGLSLSEEKIYLPLDTTWKSGAKTASNLGIEMTEPADFVIELDGTENSRVWVQSRYQTAMALYGNQMIRYFNPYIEKPDTDDTEFCKIVQPLHELNYYLEGKQIDFWDFNFNHLDRYYSLVQTHETGKLTYGNANPQAADFNSLADFCAGEDFVEIKLPWQLLNFADPTTMRIHDDYYERYGVEYLSIDAMRVGVGDAQKTIQMAEFPLEGMGDKPEYHERLKASYYILQQYWNGTD